MGEITHSYLEILENRLSTLEYELQQGRRVGSAAKTTSIGSENNQVRVQHGSSFFGDGSEPQLRQHGGRPEPDSLDASPLPLASPEPQELLHRVIVCDVEAEAYHG
jgi:hypothetical protein